MFGIFKKKSAAEKLQEKYKKVMEEAFKLQSINRSDSDQKYLEADAILKEIKQLKAAAVRQYDIQQQSALAAEAEFNEARDRWQVG